MEIKPIRNDEDHAAALEEIERLWGAAPGTPESDRLEVLGTLVDAYEERRWPIDLPDPIDAIKVRMEELDKTQSDLAELLGSASRASEILNRKRPLTMEMVRRLQEEWDMSAAVLVQRARVA